MTVADLIEALEGMDPEAEVHLMTQPEWPFEYSVLGVCRREDFEEEGFVEGEKEGRDVFLVEDVQLRYGNKGAWEAAQR